MISTDGKTHIKRYFAEMVPTVAQSIAIGIGGKAEAVGDTKLQFEVDRSDIITRSYDFLNNKVVYKAMVPDTFNGTIYEVALYSMAVDSVAGEFGSKLITTFDSDTESWLDATTAVAGTYVSTNARVGGDSLQHTPAASGTKTDSMAEIFLDLSGHSGADKFVFAFYVGNANTSSMRFRFHTDASNYYEFALGSQTSGYKVVEANKSTATVTGTPNWNNITEIRVSTTSGAGGASDVQFDGIRIDDADTINPDYVMVARELLAVPVVKPDGKVQEVEFTLDLSV